MNFDYRWVNYKGQDVPVPIPTYKYTPCNAAKGEFRLLELQPTSSTSNQSTISCKIVHCNLNDHPRFVALSYECGDPSQYECLDLDGTQFPVGLNLHRALKQLRARKCSLVWVDAICIHQTNAAEKAEHILMMKDIYHSASNVAVWLGNPDFGSEKVMTMLNAIDRSHDPNRSNGHRPWTPGWQQLQDLKPELVAFLEQRTYWERVWIVQEIATGSRVTVLCGEQDAGWKGLEILVDVIKGLAAFPDVRLRHVEHLCRMRSKRREGVPVGLLEALCGGAESKTTDFHDKVYATLGLVFDQVSFVPRVDYTMSRELMCLEMTKSWIYQHKSLDIILAAGANSQSTDCQLPSWVPNYLAVKDTHVLRKLSLYIAGQDNRYRCGQLQHKWAASGGSLISKDELQITAPNLLHVKGISIGSIAGLGAILTDRNPPLNGPASMYKTARPDEVLEESLNGALALYDTDFESVIDAQTLLTSLYTFDSIAYGLMASNELKARFHRLVDWRDRNADFCVCGTRLADYARTWSSTLTDLDAWMTIPRVVGGVSGLVNTALKGPQLASRPSSRRPPPRRRRKPNAWRGVNKPRDPDLAASLQQLESLVDEGLRLMVTDFADLGWAHPDARIGDLVVLVRGCSVPVVVRPVEGGCGDGCGGLGRGLGGGLEGGNTVYRIVGHAYGYGVMSGEAWAGVREEELVDFVIC